MASQIQNVTCVTAQEYQNRLGKEWLFLTGDNHQAHWMNRQTLQVASFDNGTVETTDCRSKLQFMNKVGACYAIH